MARDDVNIKVSADVAEAIRMWRAMEQGPKAMANEIDALGKKGKQAGSGMEAEFGRLVGKWTSIGAGIAAAKRLIDGLINAQREYNRLVKESNVPVDTLSRRYQVQGGLSNSQAAAARSQILGIAERRGATPEMAFPAATQMVSSGWSPEQVQGGGLNEFLKLMNASNATGRDVNPVEMAKNLTLFMEATGQQKTGKNLAGLSRDIQGLFKSTNLQTGDLGLFSKEAGKINQFFPDLQNKQLAILSQFEGITNTENAGTAIRKALASIRTAGATPEKMAALKSIGVDFSQVDNEGFTQVQDVLTNAFSKADSVTGNIASKKLFGEEALLAKDVLFSPAGRRQTRERFGMTADESAYGRDFAITEGSLEAKDNAATSRAAQSFADSNFLDPATVRKNMITELNRRGSWRATQQWAGFAFDMAMFVPGADAESALRGTFPGLTTENVDFRNKVLEQSRSQTPSDLKVKIELTDQNAISIPHKSEAAALNRDK